MTSNQNPALAVLRHHVSGAIERGEAEPVVEQAVRLTTGGDRMSTMFSRFMLEIELGNDAMQSGPDVAAALREVADRIERDLEARGSIRDVSGNTVGHYGPTNR